MNKEDNIKKTRSIVYKPTEFDIIQKWLDMPYVFDLGDLIPVPNWEYDEKTDTYKFKK